MTDLASSRQHARALCCIAPRVLALLLLPAIRYRQAGQHSGCLRAGRYCPALLCALCFARCLLERLRRNSRVAAPTSRHVFSHSFLDRLRHDFCVALHVIAGMGQLAIVPLLATFIVAAILGDALNYAIGARGCAVHACSCAVYECSCVAYTALLHPYMRCF